MAENTADSQELRACGKKKKPSEVLPIDMRAKESAQRGREFRAKNPGRIPKKRKRVPPPDDSDEENEFRVEKTQAESSSHFESKSTVTCKTSKLHAQL
jgi:hypothetical protein